MSKTALRIGINNYSGTNKEGPNNFSYDAKISGRFNGAFNYYAREQSGPPHFVGKVAYVPFHD